MKNQPDFESDDTQPTAPKVFAWQNSGVRGSLIEAQRRASATVDGLQTIVQTRRQAGMPDEAAEAVLCDAEATVRHLDELTGGANDNGS